MSARGQGRSEAFRECPPGSVPGGHSPGSPRWSSGSRDYRPGVPSSPIRLWEGVAPGSEEWTHDEQSMASAGGGAGERVRNVVVPTMTAYLPDEPTDRAVLVLPGGAMHFLSMVSEGTEVARFLRDRGSRDVRREVPLGADAAGRCRLRRCARQRLQFGHRRDDADGGPARRGRRRTSHGDGARPWLCPRRDVGILRRRIGHRRVDRHEPAPARRGRARLPAVLHRSAQAWPTKPPVFVAAAADDLLGIDGSLAVHDGLADGRPPGRAAPLRTRWPRLRHVAHGPAVRRVAGAVPRLAAVAVRPGRRISRSATPARAGSRTGSRCRERSGRVRGSGRPLHR